MKILAVSDVELGFLYQPQISDRFKDVDMIIGCGDLPFYYLEYMISTLNIPLYYVNGNHVSKTEYTTGGERTSPWGAINLHKRCVVDDTGVILAGIQGSLRYNLGAFQYTQGEMWQRVFQLLPAFFFNKIWYGRYLDIFVSHAPPWQIHDQPDLAHQGIKAFRWLIKVFQPIYHLHGHIHIYRNDAVTKTKFLKTTILNCYGYREINFDMHPVIEGLQRNPFLR
ncbi:MAG: hypothetical protein BGO78_03875 [Chloroflexi bacterium 44-23]|nr:MAG: hypothetical protein BGO78_03875 [Chloroflexi bacterium 44-23]